MSKPLFSVIVTTHRRSDLLSRALNSLLKQTFSDFEIILVSDVYDPPTVEVAQSFLRSSDSLLMNPNLVGPAESRNLGIQLAQGKWVMFLDDDDAYSEEYLDKLADSINSNVGASVFFTDYIKIKENRSTMEVVEANQCHIGHISVNSLMIGNFIPNSGIIVERYLARQVLFDSNLNSHEDWDWLINLSYQASFTHLDTIGPIIYEGVVDSRNQNAHSTNNASLDYLSIYRKWRSGDANINQTRLNCLKVMGLSLPDGVL